MQVRVKDVYNREALRSIKDAHMVMLFANCILMLSHDRSNITAFFSQFSLLATPLICLRACLLYFPRAWLSCAQSITCTGFFFVKICSCRNDLIHSWETFSRPTSWTTRVCLYTVLRSHRSSSPWLCFVVGIFCLFFCNSSVFSYFSYTSLVFFSVQARCVVG